MSEIVIDIGNTDLVLGYWSPDDIDPQLLRLKVGEITINNDSFKKFLNEARLKLSIKNKPTVLLSSVVPAITAKVTSTFEEIFETPCTILERGKFNLLPLDILKPEEIGTDLVANALAIHLNYGTFSVAIDFGTALSFTTVNPKGKILGVSIAPGIQTAIKALTNNTAQLYDVPIEQPKSVLGLNTEHAIQAGITYGYDGMVKGIIQAQEKELGVSLNVVCTGGLSRIIPTLADRVDHYRPFLTLEGLRLAGKIIRSQS